MKQVIGVSVHISESLASEILLFSRAFSARLSTIEAGNPKKRKFAEKIPNGLDEH